MDDEEEVVDVSQNARNSLPQPPQCGQTIKDKIYGGNTTALGEHPWAALVEYTDSML